MTAATTAKIATQITVTNQKAKAIRPASRDAGWGSQPGTSARVEAAPPATRAKSTSWTTDPRRTGNEPTRPPGALPEELEDFDTAGTSAPARARSPFTSRPPAKRVLGTNQGGSMGLG